MKNTTKKYFLSNFDNDAQTVLGQAHSLCSNIQEIKTF